MSSPVLVMLHGWGVNGAVFSSLLPALSGIDTIVVDLPGFGEASAEPAHADIDTLARAMAAKVPAGAIWLGWSLGGLVAMQAALHGYGQMKGLITLASSPRFVADDNWPGIKPAVLQQFKDSVDGDIATLIDRFLAIQAMGAPSARQDIKALREQVLARPMPSRAALAGGLAILDNTDLRPALEALNVPTLRLYGRLDALVPVAIAETLDQQLPGSRSHVFEHSSHAPFISNPQQVAAAIKVFFERDVSW